MSKHKTDKVPEQRRSQSLATRLNIVSFGLLRDLHQQVAELLLVHNTKLMNTMRQLGDIIKFRGSAKGQAVITKARELHIDSECNSDIDDATIVYHNGEKEEAGGYWVLGWCWVADADLEE